MAQDPTLSLVVTIVEGGSYVRDFLKSLELLDNPPPMDVVVPYDASIADVAAFANEFPAARFIDMGEIKTEFPIGSEAGKHELYDRRRATGLAAATGDYVAMLEDRCRPDKDWARALVKLYAETGMNVIGGAIECGEPSGLVNWAFYACDWGRYGRPFASGAVDWVSDVNLSYSRKALDDTRHLWKDRYHEPIVHWFLIERGEKLWLSNEAMVRHLRPKVSLHHLLGERFAWGRLFGQIRVRGITPAKRLLLIAAGPVIPPVLWLRHYKTQAGKGRAIRYLAALPCVMVLTMAWAMGEVWGYITRRA